MIHYSCDVCGTELDPAMEDHYVVKMTAFLAPKSYNVKESDLPVTGQHENLDDEVIELPEPEDDSFEDLEDMMLEPIGPAPSFKEFRYDLCPSCHKRFLDDPLGRETAKFDFSKN